MHVNLGLRTQDSGGDRPGLGVWFCGSHCVPELSNLFPHISLYLSVTCTRQASHLSQGSPLLPQLLPYGQGRALSPPA
jgi:hypothetical protein